MKNCSKCHVSKVEEEFSKNKSKKDGLSSECKQCHRLVRNKYYAQNRDAEKSRVKAGKLKKAQWRDDLKSGLSCKLCREDHPAVLQFHHLDPSQKDFEVSNAIRMGFSKEKIVAEIAKCVVLCANCHFKEHYSLDTSGESLLAGMV